MKMTTIVAFSDSHNLPIPDRLSSVANENDYVFFLGDGITSLGDLLFHKNLHAVKGNCDPYGFNDEELVEIGTNKILLTHGDKYHVKRDLTSLKFRAQELGCNLVFYGHTHFAQITQSDGITFICPGSLLSPLSGAPSYAYVVLTDGKITAKIVNL